MRIAIGIIVVSAAALIGVASAQETPEEQKTVKIVLYPAGEPKPALKYQLLPPLLERRPGNAAVWWNRIPAERSEFFQRFNKELGEGGKIAKWMQMSVGSEEEKAYRRKELPSVLDLLTERLVLDSIERAARFESCDWELPLREGNFIAILLPDVQQSRQYARFLSARAHLEITEGEYAEAVKTLQCGYAEARHVAQSQTLVSGLVGMTVAGIMSEQLQQFIQQPDAPNLYWAISTLPRPLVDIRAGVEAESNMLYLQFPELRDLDKKKLSPEEWRELLQRFLASYRRLIPFGSGVSNVQDVASQDAVTALTALFALQGYPSAKRYLVEQGYRADEVDAMPAAQVILLYTVRLYDELSDTQFKWMTLPAAEANQGLARVDNCLKESLRAQREIIPIASILLPAVSAAKGAETRVEWIVARLRIFEAMRMHAATHDGRWPQRLTDITEVPIPANPCDGKSFVYERRGDKAILTSETGPRGVPWRYEIRLMPAK